MHITGEPDRPPAKVGVACTDIWAGLYSHGAIMAAILSRQETGKGVWIDCNLFESQLAGLANIASNYLIAGQEALRHGTAHPSIVPYQVFPCKDGFLMIGAGNDKQVTQWLLSLCSEIHSDSRQFRIFTEKILQQPALADDPKFSSNAARVKNRTELIQIIQNVLEQYSRDHWIVQFTGLGVPFGPINNIQETFEHPQAIARGAIVEVDVCFL